MEIVSTRRMVSTISIQHIYIFENLPSRAWSIFNIKITGMGLQNRKIACDWLLQYQDHTHCSHFQPPGLGFRLYRRKTAKYEVFVHCWRSSLTLSQTIPSQAIAKPSEQFFGTKSYLSKANSSNGLIQREIQITIAIFNEFLFTRYCMALFA